VLHGRLCALALAASASGASGMAAGDVVPLTLTADRLHLFDAESGRRL